jgi:signal peptidase I
MANFAIFMEVLGHTLFPGLLYNLLYNYLSLRYGWKPNLVFRGLTVWVFYLIPRGSAISYSLLGFVNLMLPIAIYYFIDALFEKKRRYALNNTSRFSRITSKVLTVLALIFMIGTVMLVSNHFHYGAYVIATESMTGELDKGDVAIRERHEDQFIEKGQIIVFEKNKSVVIHRVVDIQIINGIARYYTQGDANESQDTGFITNDDIIGLVDEEGNESSYEMIDALEKDGVTYVALLPYSEDPEEQLDEDYQVMILKMVPDENGEEMLLSLDNEAEFNEVWAAFEDRLSDDFEIVN